MGRNAGILIGWITLSVITLTAVTLFQRRGHVRAHRALAGSAENGTAIGNGTAVVGAHGEPMSEKQEETRDRESVTEEEEEEATEEVRRV